jgi:hypothetical protein
VTGPAGLGAHGLHVTHVGSGRRPRGAGPLSRRVGCSRCSERPGRFTARRAVRAGDGRGIPYRSARWDARLFETVTEERQYWQSILYWPAISCRRRWAGATERRSISAAIATAATESNGGERRCARETGSPSPAHRHATTAVPSTRAAIPAGPSSWLLIAGKIGAGVGG